MIKPFANLLTVEQASLLSRSERLDLLMKHNEMEEPIVVGRIEEAVIRDGKKLYFLNDLHTLEGRPLELPLERVYYKICVPLDRNTTLAPNSLAEVGITVVPDKHPEIHKKGKPFALQARGVPSLLSRSKRLHLLVRHNEMEEPIVVGRIEEAVIEDGKKQYFLNDLHTLEGRPLELPLERVDYKISVLLGQNTTLALNSLAEVGITVVSDNHLEKKRGEPFALQAMGVPEPVTVAPCVAKDPEGRFLVPQSVWNAELAKITERLEKERQRLEASAREEKAELASRIASVEAEFNEKNNALQSLNDIIEKANSGHQQMLADIQNTKEDLEVLVTQKEQLMTAYQQMREFAKERASLLLDMDLISQEQFGYLVGETNSSDLEGSDNKLSWQNDLSANYERAVSAIHAFMFNQGIIYPRWLVANFLTLLRTNDLVILSGLSGAGKTQIVRSFAEALGGVAHIMPVKPNWTGAEDLLGFFNPLQRSYIRTPFLEAILSADRDRDRLHLICLDEMNLARAEYYFADFLSALEDRAKPAEISLYSESEANHVEAEVRMLISALAASGLTSSLPGEGSAGPSLDSVLKSPDAIAKLRNLFGENAAESFPAFHGRVRRVLSTVIDIPATIRVPPNVRFIGAINVDQTTYALSPKILDRAHVIRFDNPLKYSIDDVQEEIKIHKEDVPHISPIYMPPHAFMPQRCPYPEYDQAHPAAKWLQHLYRNYLIPLGLDIAFRTIRQSQMYWDLLSDVFTDISRHEAIAKNLIVMQKILPRLTIDGKVKTNFGDEETAWERWDVVREMEKQLEQTAEAAAMHPNMYDELHRVRIAAEANDKIFNYWA